MTTGTARLSERQAWNALTAHHAKVRELHLRKLFADDPDRTEPQSRQLNERPDPALSKSGALTRRLERSERQD
jgi:hypothetical protein